jgi:hypothetical protein
MVTYYITGQATYTTQANRDAVYNAIATTLANFPEVTNVATPAYAAGRNTSGTTTLTLSFSAGGDAAMARSFRQALMTNLTSATRSNHFLGVTSEGLVL